MPSSRPENIAEELATRLAPLGGLATGLIVRGLLGLVVPLGSPSSQVWIWELGCAIVLAAVCDVALVLFGSRVLARQVSGSVLTGYAATSGALGYVAHQAEGVLPAIGMLAAHFFAASAACVVGVLLVLPITRRLDKKRRTGP